MSAHDDKPPQLLNAKQAAKRLTIGLKTFYRLLSQGKLPEPIRFGPRVLRWLVEDVDRWVKEKAQAALKAATSDTSGYDMARRLVTAQLEKQHGVEARSMEKRERNGHTHEENRS